MVSCTCQVLHGGCADMFSLYLEGGGWGVSFGVVESITHEKLIAYLRLSDRLGWTVKFLCSDRFSVFRSQHDRFFKCLH